MNKVTKRTIGDFLKRIRRPIKLDENKDYKLVTIKMHHKGVVQRCIKKGSEIKSNMHVVHTGDFILSGIDARNGAFGIIPPELDGAIVTNDFWFFEVDGTIIDKQLFLELTQTSWFDEICKKGSGGVTQRIRLQKDKFFNQVIELPTKNEHEKLLKKILTVKENKNKLSIEITQQKTLLANLRQSILQDAIQGKLTEQWRKDNPNVEPASELLKRIQAEKEHLIKEKKIKKQKPLSPISPDEIPFDIPDTWQWRRLENVSQVVTDGDHQAPPKSHSGIPFIVISNIKNRNIDFTDTRFVSEKYYDSLKEEKKPQWGDILYTVTGSFGIPVLLKNVPKFCVQRHIGIICDLSR